MPDKKYKSQKGLKSTTNLYSSYKRNYAKIKTHCLLTNQAGVTMNLPKASLYGEEYTTLYQNAPHRKNIINPTMTAHALSPACGDQVIFTAIIKNDDIMEIAFTGSGSMLSQIFAELLCQYAENKKVTDVVSLTDQDIQKLLPLEISPSRFALLVFILNGLKEGLAPHA